MKTSFEILQHEIGKPESVLKRTGATKLDIALLADHVQDRHAAFCDDLKAVVHRVSVAVDDHRSSLAAAIKASDNEHLERIAAVEARIGTTEEWAGTADEKMNAASEWMRAADEKMNATDEWMRAAGEKLSATDESMRAADELALQHSMVVQNRMQSLEKRLAPLELEVASLGDIVENIERVQHTINSRLLLVMRMSVIMIGVLAATGVILGLIFF